MKTVMVVSCDYYAPQGNAFAQAARKLGHEVIEANVDSLIFKAVGSSMAIWYNGRQINPDCAILATVAYRPNFFESLQSAGVKNLNSFSAVTISDDKWLSQLRLIKHGIPMPETDMVVTVKAALQSANNIGYPVVFKTLTGDSGQGVVRAYDTNEAKDKLSQLLNGDAPVIVQKYMECGGKDKRILLLDNKIIAVMGRQAPPDGNDFRTNHDLGGKPYRVSLTPEEQTIAITASKASGLRWVGIDMATCSDGSTTIFEINSLPGILTMSEVTGVDLPTEYVKAVCADKR